MMTPGEARGLTTFIASVREDWRSPEILNAVAKLQDEGYSTQDITEACTAIALDRANKFPTMLSMKAPELIRRKHEQKVKPRSTGNGKLPDQFKCDVCGKVESKCQSDATNLNGEDHAFVSAAQRNVDREQMHADGRIAAARANAISKATRGMFALPADVTHPVHPEPEQEQAS